MLQSSTVYFARGSVERERKRREKNAKGENNERTRALDDKSVMYSRNEVIVKARLIIAKEQWLLCAATATTIHLVCMSRAKKKK